MKRKVKIITFTLFMMLITFNGIAAQTYNNFDKDSLKSCGEGLLTKIPALVPKTVSVLVTVVQIAVPVVLVIMGMLDLFKGITAQKEDEMKKSQQIFIKRLISAALVFFVIAIVKIVISVTSDNSKILGCAECFLKNKCD